MLTGEDDRRCVRRLWRELMSGGAVIGSGRGRRLIRYLCTRAEISSISAAHFTSDIYRIVLQINSNELYSLYRRTLKNSRGCPFDSPPDWQVIW